jgi:hypothetical protein
MAWELRLLEDTLAAGAALALPADGVNRICYVAHGRFSVGGHRYTDDTAWHGRGAAWLVAGEHGVAIWRFELVRAGTAAVLSEGRTLPKLACTVEPGRIAEALLLRCDSVSFPPGGCAFLHTHQGPGIRCLMEGGIRIDTAGHSTSYAPGGAWFESGPEPVFALAAERPTRFIRVTLLPAALLGKSSIAYVREEDRARPKSQSYKGYVDAPISLD